MAHRVRHRRNSADSYDPNVSCIYGEVIALSLFLSGCNYSSFIESRIPTYTQPVCEVPVVDRDTGRSGCMKRRDVERVLTGP
jgi:hypothetical protein